MSKRKKKQEETTKPAPQATSAKEVVVAPDSFEVQETAPQVFSDSTFIETPAPQAVIPAEGPITLPVLVLGFIPMPMPFKPGT